MRPGRSPRLRPSRLSDELAEKTGETIHLAQMDLGEVLYVDKRNAARRSRCSRKRSKVGPAYCTGVGKAVLAYLPTDALEAARRPASHSTATPLRLPAEGSAGGASGDSRPGPCLGPRRTRSGIICCAVSNSVAQWPGNGRAVSHFDHGPHDFGRPRCPGADGEGHCRQDRRGSGKLAFSGTDLEEGNSHDRRNAGGCRQALWQRRW